MTIDHGPCRRMIMLHEMLIIITPSVFLGRAGLTVNLKEPQNNCAQSLLLITVHVSSPSWLQTPHVSFQCKLLIKTLVVETQNRISSRDTCWVTFALQYCLLNYRFKDFQGIRECSNGDNVIWANFNSLQPQNSNSQIDATVKTTLV